jgi:hypothetical protein
VTDKGDFDEAWRAGEECLVIVSCCARCKKSRDLGELSASRPSAEGGGGGVGWNRLRR